MSLSIALNNALSGLTATARQAEVVASNVANATTPGYGRRSVELASHALAGSGQGVRVVGIRRHTDIWLQNDRRHSEAASADAGVKAGYLARFEAVFGTTDADGSLPSLIHALDTAFIAAASRPDSEARLADVHRAAQALVRGLKGAADMVQIERQRADGAIAHAVAEVNDTLQRLEALNTNIAAFNSAGRDASALLDQRQQLVDGLSRLIPVKEIPRDNDKIALITAGGAVLLDGRAAVLGFEKVNVIVPEMTLQSGALSGLTLNGQPVTTSGPASLIRGAELSALFALRDELTVESQSFLDSLSRDLVERFASPALDPSLAPGDAGLFTDNGLAFTATDELGLTQRLRLNALIDPAQGGLVTRLRDGIGSTVVGPVGNPALLTAYTTALSALRPLNSDAFTGNYSLPDLAAGMLSKISSARLSQEGEAAFHSARYQALADLEAASGVNTEEELQTLMIIEKIYAANARVMQVSDDMLSLLLEL